MTVADLKIDYVNVRYSYSPKTISTSSSAISYSYGSTVYGTIDTPFVGSRASSTQEIANALPQWMKMRQSFDSNGWKLMNSWGMNFDNVLDNTNKRLLDLSLITTDTTYFSKLAYVDIDSKELVEPKNPRNLLFNSGFGIPDVVRSKMPAGWESHSNNTGQLKYNCSVAAGCITSATGKIKIGQQRVLNNLPATKVYASVYYKTSATSVDINLVVSLEKIDGSNVNRSIKVASPSSEWARIVLPMDVNEAIYRLNFSIHAICNGQVSISAPQLELSSLTTWSKSAADYLPYYPSSSNFNMVCAASTEVVARKIPIHGIASEVDFMDVSIPTRIVRVANPNYALDAFSSQAHGRKVSQLGEITRTEFSVFEDQIVQRSISPTTFDIFGRYDIKDLRFYEDLIYGTRDDDSVSFEYLYSAIRSSWLYVVCKETTSTSTLYTLKLLRPITPPNGELYLESFTDFNLDLDFDTVYGDDQVDQEINSVSFSDVDNRILVITTTANQKYYYRLYFDYFYFNSSRNRLYTIESYPHSKIHIT